MISSKRKLGLVIISAFILFSKFSVAQSLFDLPSVICTNQRVDLNSKIKTGSTYFWHFCSATASNAPSPIALSANVGNGISQPKLIKDDDGNFYNFSISSTGVLSRLDLDQNFNVTNTQFLGTLGNLFPGLASSIDVFRDQNTGKWFGLAVGYDPASYEGYVTRIEFGSSLTNTAPIAVNFGYNQNLLQPTDLSVVQENGNIIAYTTNAFSNSLGRIDFGSSMFNNPSITDLGSNFGLGRPSCILTFEYDGVKYGLCGNMAPGGLSILNFGAKWTNSPTGTNIGNFSGRVTSPLNLSMIKDCGNILFYTKNSLNLEYTSLEFSGNFFTMGVNSLGAITSSTRPQTISDIYRTGNRIHFLEFNRNGTVTDLLFDTCDMAYDHQISYDQDPTWVKYFTPGTYTIQLIIDEGLESEQVYCETFEVIESPAVTASSDSLICQRDTMMMSVVGTNALGYTWLPNYNISNPTLTDVRVWPDSTVSYTCFISLANGCIVDTTITAEVSRVTADAGPDHSSYDASSISLGGPGTSANDTGTYYYQWTPGDEVDFPYNPYTEAHPKSSGNFILTVSNEFGCEHRDTAKVFVYCDDLHLPNAFDPTSFDTKINKFRILNNAISQLNYFRIYNRYGNLIFETTDVEEGWNGIYNGQLQPQDNYVWIVDGICSDGYQLNRTGTVLLLR